MVMVINPTSHKKSGSRGRGSGQVVNRSYTYPLEEEGRRNARNQVKPPGNVKDIGLSLYAKLAQRLISKPLPTTRLSIFAQKRFRIQFYTNRYAYLSIIWPESGSNSSSETAV